MSAARAGGCQCGVVRFTAAGAPKFVANCHCRDCRRATGAAFSTWVGYRDEAVQWTGARVLYESSPGVARGYCAGCGSPLSYQGRKWAGETHLLIGAFDDPSGLVPATDVFTEERLDWAPIVGRAE